MVEALSGGRWQGSSTASATPTPTSSGGTLNITSGGSTVLSTISTGTTSDEKWVLRYKANFGTWSANSYFHVCLSDNDNPITSAQDELGVLYRNDSGGNNFGVHTVANANPNSVNSQDQQTWSTSTSTDYYFEIVRESATSAKVNFYGTDSTYTTVSSTSSYTSVSANCDGLDKIKIMENSASNTSGAVTISDIKFYNGVITTQTDEKTTLTNVPVNSRYEETDTRKIYRAGSVEPVFYYKFDEASGDVINHGSVADADLTVSGLTRDVSTPSGIGNGMSAPSNNSGDYAQNTSRVNDYKFMHDGTTKWSVSFWLNPIAFPGSSSWTETYFFGNVWTDDNGIGWVIRMAYQSASVAKLQVFIANNTSSMPLNHSQSDMIPELNAWHHYTVTYDPSASSNQLTMTRDAATSGTGFAQTSTDNENWSTANPTRKVTFFARPTSSYDGGMAGKLAQVIIWKGHILTADEKTALYASGNGTTTLPSPLEWKERNTA